MASALRWAAAVLVLAATLSAAQETSKYGVKTVKAAPPKELDESIRKLLPDDAVQFLDPKGGLIAELWFRKEVPSDATAELLKQGPTYHEVAATTVLGAVRFAKNWSDYRKQKVKAGVYTMRLGFQPQDGDHMGTAPYPDFALLVAAAEDKSAGTMDPKKLYEASKDSTGAAHPVVFLLYPNAKPAAAPQVGTRPGNQVVVNTRTAVRAKGTEAVLGISLTLVGHAE
jgi:hypothetical protein